MIRTKGTIELKMFDANVIAKCLWIGPLAIHKQPKKDGKFSTKNYVLSYKNGLRILALDGYKLRDIYALVYEAIGRCESEDIKLDFKTWDDQARFVGVFAQTFLKHQQK